jgi:hypothetical protein
MFSTSALAVVIQWQKLLPLFLALKMRRYKQLMRQDVREILLY